MRLIVYNTIALLRLAFTKQAEWLGIGKNKLRS